MKRFVVLLVFSLLSTALAQQSEWVVYTKNNTFSSYLPSDNVTAIAIDHLGKKWIGTSDGFVMFDGKFWTPYNPYKLGLGSSWITAISVDPFGYKWIGSLGGLARFDGNYAYVFKRPYYGKSDTITALLPDLYFTWVGTNLGLARIKDFSL